MDIARYTERFERYVAQEKALERGDTGPMDLKWEHTMRVVDNARTIVGKEGVSEDLAHMCLLAALLHDIARFEQYRLYHTFKDRDSINHGHRGVVLVKKTGIVADEPLDVQHAVMSAVCLHNAFQLPRCVPEPALFITKVTRDADKLDIVRIIHGHLAAKSPYQKTVILQLPDDERIWSETVITRVLHNSVASYGDLRSVNDFRLLLASWIWDLHFVTSKALFVEQGFARRLVEAVPEEGVYKEARAHMLTFL